MQALRTGRRRAIVEESEEGCAIKSGRRRVLSLGMGVALAVWAPLSALAAWENPFRDVGAGDWFYGAVEYVNTAGLFDGTGAEAFSPNEAMTRGMFVKVPGCAAGAEPGGESASRFADVPEDAYYAPYVAWAAETGVVKGTSDTTFSLEEPITREDMAVMLYQYAEARGFDTSYDGANLLDFPDAGEISSYAQVPMAWAVTQGVLAGSGGYLAQGGRHPGGDGPDLLQRAGGAGAAGGAAGGRSTGGGRISGRGRTAGGGSAAGGGHHAGYPLAGGTA